MATEIILDSKQRKTYCQELINEIELDGKKSVVIKNTDMDPTAKQNRLRWMWMGEISNSGLGSNDTKIGADLTAKWQFARPILLRDNKVFALTYKGFMDLVENSEIRSEQIKEFTRDYMSVSKLMSRKQEAEYLTDIQKFWDSKGIGLTSPVLQGLDVNCFGKNRK